VVIYIVTGYVPSHCRDLWCSGLLAPISLPSSSLSKCR